MASKGLYAIIMILVAVLLALLGYIMVYYNSLYYLANPDFIYMLAFGLWIASGIIVIMGISLAVFRFVKWAIND